MSQLNIDDVRKEAKDLGITYGPTSSAESIAKKIAKFHEEREAGAETVTKKPETENTKDGGKDKKSVEDPKLAKARKREAAARVLRKVIINDNDRRVNEHTTTAVASCGNEFFDLGSRILPLNEIIECSVGHIKNLEQVEIPVHVSNDKTGLSQVRMRKRYNIAYQDGK